MRSPSSRIWWYCVAHSSSGADLHRVSPAFPFHRDGTFYDDEIYTASSSTCVAEYAHFVDVVYPCFHNGCFDFRLLPITPNLLDATGYTFQPDRFEEQQRFERIWRLLVPRLQDLLPAKLPVEVLAIIAKLLVRECAVVTTQEQTSGSRNLDDLVDLTWQCVCAVSCDGRHPLCQVSPERQIGCIRRRRRAAGVGCAEGLAPQHCCCRRSSWYQVDTILFFGYGAILLHGCTK